MKRRQLNATVTDATFEAWRAWRRSRRVTTRGIMEALAQGGFEALPESFWVAAQAATDRRDDDGEGEA